MHIFSLVCPCGSRVSSRQPSAARQRRENGVVGSEQFANVVVPEGSGDLGLLSRGSKNFHDNLAATDPGLLKLADEGQRMMCPKKQTLKSLGIISQPATASKGFQDAGGTRPLELNTSKFVAESSKF